MEQPHNRVYIPQGITFGTKVAVIPPVAGSFAHRQVIIAEAIYHVPALMMRVRVR